jgi:hypothetical protein
MRLFMGVLALTILPFASFAGDGRYQAAAAGEIVYVLDTKTGEVIKYCRFSDCFEVEPN